MTKWFRKWQYWLPLFALFALVASGAARAGEDKVTLCHAAGQEGTTQYVTITVGYPAAFGPAGHFYENGTPRAGHEQDYLGPCQETPPPPPPPPPSGECPEGYVQQGDDPILCLKTVEVEKIVERVVTVTVPGPERVVEVVKEVPVEKIVEVPVTVTKTVVKVKKVPVVKTKTVVKWKTKTVIKRVPGKTAVCACPEGYRLWKGKCHAIVRGNG